MDICVVGLGKIGREVASILISEGHNLTVIDSKDKLVEDFCNTYDCIGYKGNGAILQTLIDANVASFDMLIALTSSDETNILSCISAKQLGIKKTIARLKDKDFENQIGKMNDIYQIDAFINPNRECALEIFRILEFPSASKVETFSNGKVDLVEVTIKEDSVLNGCLLSEIYTKFGLDILVCSVKRGEEVIIPKGDFKFQADDLVYLCCRVRDLAKSFKKLNLYKQKVKTILIIGASLTCQFLVKNLLEEGYSVKVVDIDENKLNELLSLYPQVECILGDVTNKNLLMRESIESMDAVVSITGIDETNIVISSLASKLGVSTCIAKVNNKSFDSVIGSIGINSIVSPSRVFADEVLKRVRTYKMSESNQIVSLQRLLNDSVEAIEFVVSSECEHLGKELKELPLKDNIIISSIIRGKEVISPKGSSQILDGDRVLICTTLSGIKEFKDIFK